MTPIRPSRRRWADAYRLLSMMTRAAHGTGPPQVLKKLLFQGAARLDVKATIDGLVRHVVLLGTRKHMSEPSSNLLGRPLQFELAGDRVGQFPALDQLTRFGATPLIPSMLIRLHRTVGFAPTIASDFPADR